jgi:hypothetical protein
MTSSLRGDFAVPLFYVVEKLFILVTHLMMSNMVENELKTMRFMVPEKILENVKYVTPYHRHHRRIILFSFFPSIQLNCAFPGEIRPGKGKMMDDTCQCLIFGDSFVFLSLVILSWNRK